MVVVVVVVGGYRNRKKNGGAKSYTTNSTGINVHIITVRTRTYRMWNDCVFHVYSERVFVVFIVYVFSSTFNCRGFTSFLGNIELFAARRNFVQHVTRTNIHYTPVRFQILTITTSRYIYIYLN